MQQKIEVKLEQALRQLRKSFPTKRIRLRNGVTLTIRRLDDWRLHEVADAVRVWTYGFAWEQAVTVKIKPNTTIYLVYISKPYDNRTVAKLADSLKSNCEQTIRSASIIVYPCETSEKTVEGTILTRKELKCFSPSESMGQLLLTAILTGVPSTVVPLMNANRGENDE